jgi:hypothetical protein
MKNKRLEQDLHYEPRMFLSEKTVQTVNEIRALLRDKHQQGFQYQDEDVVVKSETVAIPITNLKLIATGTGRWRPGFDDWLQRKLRLPPDERWQDYLSGFTAVLFDVSYRPTELFRQKLNLFLGITGGLNIPPQPIFDGEPFKEDPFEKQLHKGLWRYLAIDWAHDEKVNQILPMVFVQPTPMIREKETARDLVIDGQKKHLFGAYYVADLDKVKQLHEKYHRQKAKIAIEPFSTNWQPVKTVPSGVRIIHAKTFKDLKDVR